MNKVLLFFLLMQFTVCIAIRAEAQTKPGDIASNAKILDADELQPFSDGVAVIKKGTATALIDASGNFVVPFGKYKINSSSKSELMIVSCPENPYSTGLINKKGVLVLTCHGQSTTAPYFNFDEKGYARTIIGTKTFFINAKGEKILFNPVPTYKFIPTFYSEGLGAFMEKDKYGYTDHSGKTVIKPQFNAAGAFSEGLAVVGKENEFGELKFGFIDRLGNVIIPFQYSNKPNNFSNGLACVEPVKKDEFSYAYINKKGEIVIKINKGLDGNKILPPDYGLPDFINGFVKWHTLNNNTGNFQYYLIDTTGKLIKMEDFLQDFGISAKRLHMMPNVSKSVVWKLNSDAGQSWLNLKTKKTLPFIYRQLNTDAYDSESKLTYAEVLLEPSNSQKIRKGYINEDGVFVIVMAERSVF